tara:strand:+ start:932 stop:2491 length:1560 start_codon:yes stop_codon:yes gene_type:complete
MLVIIPTAGIGSRLDLNTKYFNKAMIQMGDTPVISKIIDSYPSNTQFIVITGYKGDQIEEYLKLVYSSKKIKIVKVSNYDGPGSGLTLSLKNSLHYINKPFFFHANDTIFTDRNFFKNIKTDTMFIQKGNSDSMKYATVELKKNNKKIHNKLAYLRKDFFNYTGVAFISNIKKFKETIIKDELNQGELAYLRSLDPNKINFKFINNWFDIGSKETKEKAEKYFMKKNILPKNDQGIFFKNGKVYKFFANPEIINSRVKRSTILKNYVPKVINYKKYFYVYNYTKGKVFSAVRNKPKEFYKLLNWLNDNFWTKKNLSTSKHSIFKQKCNSFYYEKTLTRINYLYEKNNLKDKNEKINGESIKKISSLFEKVNWREINNGLPVNFHGDLHFENIIKNKKKVTLLDWRENFSGIINYGDIYYDLAKINHGLIIDHNIIKNEKFYVDVKKNNTKFNFYQSKINKHCQKIFFSFIKKNNFSKSKINILTALIFLNIAGLHHYPYSIFLYYLGKFSLHKALKNKS